MLGPIEIVHEGVVSSPAGRSHRALLGVLVLSIGHPVPVDHLIDALWGDEPPHDARAALHSSMSRLRHELPVEVIEQVEGSYCLDLAAEHLDAYRFETEIAAAEDHIQSEPRRALTHARAALELWRGMPYGDLDDFEPAMLEVHRLEELRSRAMELAWESSIGLGHHDRVVGSLQSAVLTEPYRERLWYLLIVALSRSGRRVEALRAYDRLCAILGELGLEPTADVRELATHVAEDDLSTRPHFAHEVAPTPYSR